jgi:hypothetical protein
MCVCVCVCESECASMFMCHVLHSIYIYILHVLHTHTDEKGVKEVGYLAQHDLLEQIPSLKKDIHVPDYCFLNAECVQVGEGVCVCVCFASAIHTCVL